MTGMVVLVAAIVVGNTVLAAIAIAIAVVGLLSLGRDWRRERKTSAADSAADLQSAEGGGASPVNGLRPELFTPDVSYEEALQDFEDDDDDEELDVERNG